VTLLKASAVEYVYVLKTLFDSLKVCSNDLVHPVYVFWWRSCVNI